MIVNIRGTHGSGKSTICLEILKRFPHQALPSPEERKPTGYAVTLSRKKTLFIVGPYKTACGGCDAIQPYELIWPRVESAADLGGHVLFEGALVSSSVGNIGRAMAARAAHDCVVAFMSTPIEECIRRIERRRRARGDDRPLDPTNTVRKHQAVLNSRPKLEALGLRCVTVPRRGAVEFILGLFK